MEGAWWYQDEVIFYNNEYKANQRAQESLREAEIIGVYFGSYASRATRLFTKFVRKFHAEIRNRTNKFQIIFCSMDDNEKDCHEFVTLLHGDWLVIPWNDQSNRRNVRNQCNVSSHPALVILKNQDDGIVISVQGKEEIQELGNEAFELWQELSVAAAKLSIDSEP